MRFAIAAEARRVAVDPGDGAAHLVGHRGEVALGLDHVVEVDRDVVRARMHESLGLIGGVPGEPAAPRAAMDEHMHRRILFARRIEVEPLDRRRPIGEALRRAEPRAHLLAVGRIALDDLGEVCGVFRLVVGVVELLLVQVEPHQRAFLARLRQRDAAGRCQRRAGKNGPSIEVTHRHLP